MEEPLENEADNIGVVFSLHLATPRVIKNLLKYPNLPSPTRHRLFKALLLVDFQKNTQVTGSF